ncbi:Eukaryotic translation initiation factor 2 subunit beta-like protein [Drosera capensis]
MLDDNLSTAEDGLLDPWVCSGFRVALQRRVLHLGKPPRRWKTPSYAQSMKRKIHEVGRLAAKRGRRADFYGEDGEQCGVEQLALQYYAGEGRGWQGIHTETGIWLTIFGLLMWDIIFADVPNVFCNQFQESHQGTACRGVNWQRRSLSELRAAVACIGGPCLALLCRLLAQDYRIWSRGMLDLLLWRFHGDYRGEAKLVEVKGPRDRLSEQQRAWLLVLMDCGFDAEIIMATDENRDDMKGEVPEIAAFDPTKKKKKKKVTIQEPHEEPVEKLVEKTENLSVSEGLEPSFVGLKKKKKKPVEVIVPDDDAGEGGDDRDDIIGEDEEAEGITLQMQQPHYPWEDGTDQDYTYRELSGRVFGILREHNPELAGDRRRTVMRPPQVLREGTKKTVFVNFMDLCKTMHRQPEHVMNFLLAEMGTNGSLDGQQRLVVKGRFAPKNFEGILRRYVNEYVICNGCKSADTILTKENRLFFLRCEQCGSGRSVAPIKAGFVARVGRRNAGA